MGEQRESILPPALTTARFCTAPSSARKLENEKPVQLRQQLTGFISPLPPFKMGERSESILPPTKSTRVSFPLKRCSLFSFAYNLHTKAENCSNTTGLRDGVNIEN
jgi:hypothetical protein